MTEVADADPEVRPFSADELAAVIQVYRGAMGWSQEQLADVSGLAVRTVQRVENAEPSSADTRRALARAFELPDIDVFNKPHEFKTEEQLCKEAEAFEKTNVVLDVSVLTAGKQLTDLAERMMLHCIDQPDDLPVETAELVASIFDQFREYHDCSELYSLSDKVPVQEGFTELAADLKRRGFQICIAERDTTVVGKNWVDKTPLAVTIAYLLVAPVGSEPKQIAVPRAIGKIAKGF